MNQHNGTAQYGDEILDYLQLFRGEGFLSPGGADETRRVLERVSLEEKNVLEVGSGLGGCCLIIAGEHHAEHVLGLDVEPTVVERARKAVKAAGLADKISFQLVEPGPLPVSSDSFDVVFSKDAMCHIEDKTALYAELFRVLKPGGKLAAGDWLRDSDVAYSVAMQKFVETTGLSFFLDSLNGVKVKLEQAGFSDVDVVNRNQWFRDEARREAALLEGPLAHTVEALRGKQVADHSNECQRLMIAVLDSGEFCPAHFFATKSESEHCT
jgi:SAM-dependent methyltransferase